MIPIMLGSTVIAIGFVAFLAAGATVSLVRRTLIVCTLPVALTLPAVSAYMVATGPLPHWMEYRHGETELVAYRLDEGRAIYLWVTWPDDHLPRAYTLPWSEETAEAIETAEGDQEQGGGEVTVDFNSEGDQRTPEEGDLGERLSEMFSMEDRPPPTVHARPHPRLPAKPPPQAGPTMQFPRGWAAPNARQPGG